MPGWDCVCGHRYHVNAACDCGCPEYRASFAAHLGFTPAQRLAVQVASVALRAGVQPAQVLAMLEAAA